MGIQISSSVEQNHSWESKYPIFHVMHNILKELVNGPCLET
jgi:hypothetical protein